MNQVRHTDVPTLCFAFLLLVGICAVLVPSVLPSIQLDRVLSAEEFQDESKVASTRAMLELASGKMWLLWTGLGIAITALSSVGLWELRNERRSAN